MLAVWKGHFLSKLYCKKFPLLHSAIMLAPFLLLYASQGDLTNPRPDRECSRQLSTPGIFKPTVLSDTLHCVRVLWSPHAPWPAAGHTTPTRQHHSGPFLWVPWAPAPSHPAARPTTHHLDLVCRPPSLWPAFYNSSNVGNTSTMGQSVSRRYLVAGETYAVVKISGTAFFLSL